jgi:hypothetical protein
MFLVATRRGSGSGSGERYRDMVAQAIGTESNIVSRTDRPAMTVRQLLRECASFFLPVQEVHRVPADVVRNRSHARTVWLGGVADNEVGSDSEELSISTIKNLLGCMQSVEYERD